MKVIRLYYKKEEHNEFEKQLNSSDNNDSKCYIVSTIFPIYDVETDKSVGQIMNYVCHIGERSEFLNTILLPDGSINSIYNTGWRYIPLGIKDRRRIISGTQKYMNAEGYWDIENIDGNRRDLTIFIQNCGT